ncbi:MAG: polysaccharide biosynthesis C-terminal domain-containing protein [Deltaproteobacteria bacterium]|nr:polysaccharide biosynthesis C-terminal domain-containing protein [Deltaproteobacteria bacterium]
MRLGERLLGGVCWSALSRVTGIVVGFVLAPYVLLRVGAEGFGLWSLAAVTVNYLGLVDLGVSAAYLRTVAFFHARGDQDGLEQAIHTGMLFYCGLFAVLTVPAWWLAPRVAGWLQVPEPLRPLATAILLGNFAILAVRQTTGSYRAVLLGIQRLGAANGVMTASALLHALFTVAVLEAGWGLGGLVAEGLGLAVFCAAANAWFCRRLVPGLRLIPRRWNGRSLPELVSYGFRVQGAGLAGLVNGQVDKVALAVVVGLAAAAHYEIGSKIPLQAANIPEFLLLALVPAAAELQAKGDAQGVRKLVLYGSRYLLLLGLPLAAVFGLEAQALLTFWMGPAQWTADMAHILRVLTVLWVASLVTAPLKMVARGLGAPRAELRASASSAALNVVFTTLLTPVFGLDGALGGTVVAVGLGAAGLLWTVHRSIELRWCEALTTSYLPAVLPAVLSTLAWVGLVHFLPDPSSRGLALLRLCAAGSVLTAGTLGGSWLLGFRDETDARIAGRLMAVFGRRTGRAREATS